MRLSRLELGSHNGTHIDVPAHFIEGGAETETLPLELLVGPAWVADLTAVSEGMGITIEHLEAAMPESPVERLLLKTRNSALWGRDYFQPRFVFLTPEAAQWLVERGIKSVGIDYLSIEKVRRRRPQNPPRHPRRKRRHHGRPRPLRSRRRPRIHPRLPPPKSPQPRRCPSPSHPNLRHRLTRFIHSPISAVIPAAQPFIPANAGIPTPQLPTKPRTANPVTPSALLSFRAQPRNPKPPSPTKPRNATVPPRATHPAPPPSFRAQPRNLRPQSCDQINSECTYTGNGRI